MTRPPARLGVLLLLYALAGTGSARAQDALNLVNDSTEVRYLKFRFVDDHFMDAERLEEQMVTRAPGFLKRVQDWLSFLPLVRDPHFPFSPIELQRDMERLRRYYVRNGFLQPSIDYPASQFDASSNRMGVIVTVREGRAVTVDRRDVVLADSIRPELGPGWQRLVSRLTLRPGDRFTDFERLTMETRVRAWLREEGYAFADVSARVSVDSSAFLASIDVEARPGPPARIDSIRIEGARSVSRRVILRQVPFAVGDPFDASDLEDGQRSLFGLGLFRVALVDVPSQPEDSTVTIRIRVREALPRLFSSEVGYSRANGLDLQASLRHRNFLGAARQLSLSAAYETGLLADPAAGRSAVRRFTITPSLHQPYFLARKLSATLSLYYRWVDDRNQLTKYREIGVTPTLLYEFYPYRTASLQFGASRAIPIRVSGSLTDIGVYSRSTLTASVAAGWYNNYLHPRKGFMIRPNVEVAGLLFGELSYTKATLNVASLIPITRRSSFGLFATVGRLVPTGGSRDQSSLENEYRFDAVRYYAGGANDVRGWSLNTLGPKYARADTVIADTGSGPGAPNATFESVGGLGKVSFTAEFRFPAPGLGSSWQLGAFVDGGAIPSTVQRDASGRLVRDENGQPIVVDHRLPRGSDFRFGTGIGLRYLTPVGAVRFDVAWKLNPEDIDLQDPGQRVLFDAGLRDTPPEEHTWSRLNFHLSIDRTF